MVKLFYNISNDIIHKFCPNYKVAYYINKAYDGTWISPLESDVNNQFDKINKCINLIK